MLHAPCSMSFINVVAVALLLSVCVEVLESEEETPKMPVRNPLTGEHMGPKGKEPVRYVQRQHCGTCRER